MKKSSTIIDDLRRSPFDVNELSREAQEGLVEMSHDTTGDGALPFGAPRRNADLQDSPGTAPSRGDNPTVSPTYDPVTLPRHYNVHPSGVECIEITEWMNFNLGNCVKYIWRADEKGATIQDLEKARWYLDREISRLKRLAR